MRHHHRGRRDATGQGCPRFGPLFGPCLVPCGSDRRRPLRGDGPRHVRGVECPHERGRSFLPLQLVLGLGERRAAQQADRVRVRGVLHLLVGEEHPGDVGRAAFKGAEETGGGDDRHRVLEVLAARGQVRQVPHPRRRPAAVGTHVEPDLKLHVQLEALALHEGASQAVGEQRRGGPLARLGEDPEDA